MFWSGPPRATRERAAARVSGAVLQFSLVWICLNQFWEFKKRRCYTWRLIPQSFQHDSIVPEWNPCIGFQVLKAAAYRRGLGVHITVLEIRIINYCRLHIDCICRDGIYEVYIHVFGPTHDVAHRCCADSDQGQPIRTPRDARGDSCPTPNGNVSLIFVEPMWISWILYMQIWLGVYFDSRFVTLRLMHISDYNVLTVHSCTLSL